MGRYVICPDCGGNGKHECEYCNGQGYLADGVICNACAGTRFDRPCDNCGGSGNVWEED